MWCFASYLVIKFLGYWLIYLNALITTKWNSMINILRGVGMAFSHCAVHTLYPTAGTTPQGKGDDEMKHATDTRNIWIVLWHPVHVSGSGHLTQTRVQDSGQVLRTYT